MDTDVESGASPMLVPDRDHIALHRSPYEYVCEDVYLRFASACQLYERSSDLEF